MVSTGCLAEKIEEKFIAKPNPRLLHRSLCALNCPNVRRYIIDHSGKKANLYGCQQDNWSRLTFADYSVPVPATADCWVLLYRLDSILHHRTSSRLHISNPLTTARSYLATIFFCRACREVFLIPKTMPLAIKIYSPSPHFLLHIVNNDTVEELDMPFNIYQPNKVADVHISVVLLRFHPHLQ